MTTAQPWSRISLESSISIKDNVASRTAAFFAVLLLACFFGLTPTSTHAATCVAEVDPRATTEVIIYGAVLENLPADGEVPPLRCNGNGEVAPQSNGESASGVPTLLPSANVGNGTLELSTQEAASSPASNGNTVVLATGTDETPQTPGKVVALSDTVAEESPSIPSAATPVEDPSVPQVPDAPGIAETPKIETDEIGTATDQLAESEPSVVEAGSDGGQTPPGEEQTAANTLALIATIYFEAGSSALNEEGKTLLKETATRMKADEGMRVQLLAYSAEDPDVPNAARRTSLSRALAVRKFLTSEGVASVRLQIRALGAKVLQGDPDRVDIQPQKG